MPRSAFTPKAPVYFPKGTLRYFEGGHGLTKNGRYYVCAEGQKGLCKIHTRSLLRENVERNFSRLADNLHIPEGENELILNKMLKEIFHYQIDYVIDHDDSNDEFDAILDVIREDIQAKKKRQLNKDAQEARDLFLEKMKRNTMDVVCSLLIGSLMTFARIHAKDSEYGRTLAFLSDEVLISDDGTIEKIKLNTIGSYIYQYIRKQLPWFGENIKDKLEYKKFERLDLPSISAAVDSGKLKDVIPYDPFNTAYGITTISRYFLGSIRGVKPQNLLIAILILENSAILTTAFTYRRIMGGYI